jgi:hypothetical protein
LTTYYYRSDGRLNNVATSLLQTTSTDPLNPTIGPGQYQLFGGLTGSSFALTTGGSITTVISNNVFGLQIVETQPVPEPETISLVLTGLGTLGTVCLRRRRPSACGRGEA